MTQYVLITGASSGIGEALARQFAGAGHNLIISARREERLETLAGTLRERDGVQVEVVCADLGHGDGVARLADTVTDNGWGLDGLVNNAGFGDRGAFAQRPHANQMAMIQVNIGAVVDLTHRLIPVLEESSQPFIINLASLAAFQPGPDMAVYYASKAFVLSFSQALTEELRGRIAVSALCPGATDSEFADRAEMRDSLLFKLGTMSSDQVARVGFNQRRRAIVIPGFRNRLTVWLGKITPRALLRRIAGRLNS